MKRPEDYCSEAMAPVIIASPNKFPLYAGADGLVADRN